MQRENLVELSREELTENGLIRYFIWNDKEYVSENSLCYPDDVSILFNAVLKQAVADFTSLSNKENLKDDEKETLETARGFLFDDEYTIEWASMDLSVRDIVSYLTGSEPNMEMFRNGIRKYVGKNLSDIEKEGLKNKETEDDSEE